MPFVSASDGVPLHYSSVGTGQPIVLVHGWTMNGRFFSKNVGTLTQDHRVITVDVRCHGLSGKELVNLTMEQVGRDIYAVLDRLGLSRVILVGWSMGMNAVFNYVDQFGTGRLAGLVDVDMGPCLFAEDGWPHPTFGNMTPRASLDAQRALVLDRAAAVSALIPAMFAAGAPPSQEDLEWWTDQSRTVPDLAALALWVSFYSQDWRSLLPSIDVPVLLAHGVKSQIFPSPVWESLQAAIPETILSLFENSGHSPFWEEPDKFNAEVAKFAASI